MSSILLRSKIGEACTIDGTSFHDRRHFRLHVDQVEAQVESREFFKHDDDDDDDDDNNHQPGSHVSKSPGLFYLALDTDLPFVVSTNQNLLVVNHSWGYVHVDTIHIDASCQLPISNVAHGPSVEFAWSMLTFANTFFPGFQILVGAEDAVGHAIRADDLREQDFLGSFDRLCENLEERSWHIFGSNVSAPVQQHLFGGGCKVRVATVAGEALTMASTVTVQIVRERVSGDDIVPPFWEMADETARTLEEPTIPVPVDLFVAPKKFGSAESFFDAIRIQLPETVWLKTGLCPRGGTRILADGSRNNMAATAGDVTTQCLEIVGQNAFSVTGTEFIRLLFPNRADSHHLRSNHQCKIMDEEAGSPVFNPLLFRPCAIDDVGQMRGVAGCVDGEGVSLLITVVAQNVRYSQTVGNRFLTANHLCQGFRDLVAENVLALPLTVTQDASGISVACREDNLKAFEIHLDNIAGRSVEVLLAGDCALVRDQLEIAAYKHFIPTPAVADLVPLTPYPTTPTVVTGADGQSVTFSRGMVVATGWMAAADFQLAPSSPAPSPGVVRLTYVGSSSLMVASKSGLFGGGVKTGHILQVKSKGEIDDSLAAKHFVMVTQVHSQNSMDVVGSSEFATLFANDAASPTWVEVVSAVRLMVPDQTLANLSPEQGAWGIVDYTGSPRPNWQETPHTSPTVRFQRQAASVGQREVSLDYAPTITYPSCLLLTSSRVNLTYMQTDQFVANEHNNFKVVAWLVRDYSSRRPGVYRMSKPGPAFLEVSPKHQVRPITFDLRTLEGTSCHGVSWLARIDVETQTDGHA